MFRFAGALLCLVFVILSVRYSSANVHEGSEINENKLIAAMQNVVPSRKELVSDTTTTLRKEMNKEEFAHDARKCYGLGKMKHFNDEKCTINSEASNNTPKKHFNVDSLLVFSADYGGPEVHPPQHFGSDD